MVVPAVEIIIPHFNGVEILRHCLRSLSQVTWSSLRITVVDNASTDRSVEMIEAEFPAVNILRNERNSGFAGGCNSGIRASQSPWLLLLNNDTEVEPGFIEPLVELLERNPQVAAVQPRICSLSHPGYLDYAGGVGGMLDRYGYPFAIGRIFNVLEPDHGQYRTARPIFWASGTAVLYRAAALEQVGLLDEQFFMHMEEIDLAWRLQLAGWEIKGLPTQAVYHHAGYSLPAGAGRKAYLNFRNSLIMMLKNYQTSTLLRRLPVRIALDAVAILHALFRGDFATVWGIKKGYLWLLFHPRLVCRLRREAQACRRFPDSTIDRALYPGSIVWSHFVRGVRLFSELDWDIAEPETTGNPAAL